MKNIKYFFQFVIIIFLFSIFRILGLNFSIIISKFIFSFLGPFFRSKQIYEKNLKKAFPDITRSETLKISKNMWSNYGCIFAEYMFLKDFRRSLKLSEKISVENQNELKKIKDNKKPVIFISGHFNNFELMAMHIEKSGIDLAAVYRPLNNHFLNPVMEKIRKKYICKKQISKGIVGTKELLKNFKNGSSIAMMIDQRVSEGIRSNFFGEEALTTTIPAQFVKKYNVNVVPVYIERVKDNNFKIKILESIKFDQDENIESITLQLNKILEKMILQNPDQWIWTHNRWK